MLSTGHVNTIAFTYLAEALIQSDLKVETGAVEGLA